MPTPRYPDRTIKTLEMGDLRKKGTEVYSSDRPDRIMPAADDTIITASKKDRLDSLANKYYGSPTYWYVIASVNGLVGGNLHVPPGIQLRIPSRDRVVG